MAKKTTVGEGLAPSRASKKKTAKKKTAKKKTAKKKTAKATASTTRAEVMAQLEAMGREKVRAQNTKAGAGKNQFGVLRGDVRKLAKAIKTNHELALDLWKTKNIDARFLAVLLLEPAQLSAKEADRMVRSLTFVQVADWFSSYVLKKHPEKEGLRQGWMTADDPMAARAGWSLTAERVAKSPAGLDLEALLRRIESELAEASPEAQWTMNMCLVEIGIHHPTLRKRALAIGERLGVYREFHVPKGCTSPFAPIWINAMVARQR